jgi:hypothetical protein
MIDSLIYFRSRFRAGMTQGATRTGTLKRTVCLCLALGILTCLPARWLGGPGAARADMLIFDASGSIPGEGPVSAKVTFTAENGDIKIVVQNLGPTSSMGAAQAISELFFSVNGSTVKAADLKLASVSGPTISFNPTSTGSASFSGSTLSSAHWGFGGTGGNALELATVAASGHDNIAPKGNPTYMIMSENATPNGTVSNFDPYFNGSATFILSDKNVTSATALNISGVQFGFGTGPELALKGTITPVPAPSSLVLALTGLGGLGLAYLRRLRRRAPAA